MHSAYGTETCNLQDDFLVHPLIKAFLIGVGVVWVTFILILLLLFCKYRILKTKYSKLAEDSNNTLGEIEMKNM